MKVFSTILAFCMFANFNAGNTEEQMPEELSSSMAGREESRSITDLLSTAFHRKKKSVEILKNT